MFCFLSPITAKIFTELDCIYILDILISFMYITMAITQKTTCNKELTCSVILNYPNYNNFEQNVELILILNIDEILNYTTHMINICLIMFKWNSICMNLYIFKALNETKNILTLSRLSDPIY
jgi:hypothetical protein